MGIDLYQKAVVGYAVNGNPAAVIVVSVTIAADIIYQTFPVDKVEEFEDFFKVIPESLLHEAYAAMFTEFKNGIKNHRIEVTAKLFN